MEYTFQLITTYGFPLFLSVFLIWKIDIFLSELIKNQKDFSQNIITEIKEIKIAINDLKLEYAKNR